MLNSIRGPLRSICALAAAGMAAAQPVSFSRDVAPILAMNCHLCHGANPDSAAGGLSTRTWKDLMNGSNLGPVIVAGDPPRSPLYQFISGDRGEAHRMPLGGPALDAAEIETIRRWIAEGASADEDRMRPPRLTLASIAVARDTPLLIRARVSAAAYVSLELAGNQGVVLYLDGGAVRERRGVAAIGAPGEWITWRLRMAPDWPRRVRVTLSIAYAGPELQAELIAGSRRVTLR